MSNNLLKDALTNKKPSAYNPFQVSKDSNIEQALVDVTANAKSTLLQTDLKIYSADVFTLPHGNIDFRINNIQNKRAPTADRFYGYFADAHKDLGRNITGT